MAGGAAAWAISRYVGVGWWVPAALGLGWLVHLIGDMLTTGGVPLLWPYRRRVAWPVLARTGSAREALFGAALLVAVVVLGVSPLSGVGRGVGGGEGGDTVGIVAPLGTAWVVSGAVSPALMTPSVPHEASRRSR